MAVRLANQLACIKHSCGVYEQNSIVSSVLSDDRTAKLAIIASNGLATFSLTSLVKSWIHTCF